MWFIFALLSAVFAGLQSFGQKIAAEQRLDTYLSSTISAFVSSILAFIFFVVTLHDTPTTALLYGLGLLSGLLFIGFSVTRLESLQYIDAAIFFPLYKVVGPALVAGIGIILFQEHVTNLELFGIILSCFIPILLITKSEHKRQKNLRLGIIFMLVSAILSAVAMAVNTFAVKADPNVIWLFSTIANGSAGIFGAALYFNRHRRTSIGAALKMHITKRLLHVSLFVGFMQLLSFYFLLLAVAGGDLSLAYSINAHYILIPVLLSVWFYKEHWNKQKAAALVLSLLALVLLHR